MTIIFGPEWERELWASPYSLRFELAIGDSYVNMFTTAYDRARQLARAALPSERVMAVIAAYPYSCEMIGFDWREWGGRYPFHILQDMGVSTVPWEAIWMGHRLPPEHRSFDDPLWEHRAANLTWEQADILLWNNLAQDIGVEPRAPVVSKLVDVQRGVTVHPYDDRGMDITALERETIVDLYTGFDAWLLDYDRSRMFYAFELMD